MLCDRFGRIHNYLRVSLTEHCNLSCAYCMPAQKLRHATHSMSAGELFEIAREFVNLGISKIRLTGGEPLVRKDAELIISKLSDLGTELTLTTNGVLVHRFISTFKKASIRSLNLSLDTLSAGKFLTLTGKNEFNQVWKNIQLLLNEDFHVKLNVVLMKDFNTDEICDFVELTRKLPLHVRFIEFMPFSNNGWSSGKVFSRRQILEKIEQQYSLFKLKDEKQDTAEKFKVYGFEGTLAIISSMSKPFCGNCNRLRLLADGSLKNCLFSADEINLLHELRKGNDIKPLIMRSLFLKHEERGAQFTQAFENLNYDQLKNRSMVRIGG